MKVITLLTFLFLLLVSDFSVSKTKDYNLDLSVGLQRNFHISSFSNKNYALFYRAQFEGPVKESILNWAVGLSYMDEDAEPNYDIPDLNLFYSYESFNIGVKVYLLSRDFFKSIDFIDMAFFLGFSHSFVNGKNIYRSETSFSEKVNFGIDIMNLGAKITFLLNNRIGIFSAFEYNIHLYSPAVTLEDQRSSLEIGLTYNF